MSSRKSPTGVYWALGSGTVVQGLNSSIIAVALVSIAQFFNTTDGTAWLISSMYLASAIGAPVAGRLGDLYGPRKIFLAGLGLVVVASVVASFAPSMGVLIAARVLLALGAACQFPNAMAILRREADLRSITTRQGMTVLSFCGQTMIAIGPTIGGLLVGAFGWQSIFWINLPIALASAFWVLSAVVPDEKKIRLHTDRGFDVVGMLGFAVVLSALMFSLLQLDDLIAGNPVNIAVAVAVPVLVTAYVLFERRMPNAFLDLSLVASNRRLSLVLVRNCIMFVSFYTCFYALPQWLETDRGLSLTVVGVLMIPVFAAGVISTFIANAVGQRLTDTAIVTLGSALVVIAGTLATLILTVDTPLWLIAVIGFALGFPNGFNNLGNQLLLQRSVDPSRAGVAAGVYRTAQYVGAALSAVIVSYALPVGAGAMHVVGLWIAALGTVLLLLNLTDILRRRARR